MTTIDTSSAVFRDTVTGYSSMRQAWKLIRLRVQTRHSTLTEDSVARLLLAVLNRIKTSEERLMAFFLAQATYATEGYRGMISDPHDRGPAMEALAEASGVKIIFMGYAVATGQITGIFEGTLKNVGGMEFAVLASGAMADFKVTELISLADMADLMQAGSEISNRYTPPNRDEIDRILLDE